VLLPLAAPDLPLLLRLDLVANRDAECRGAILLLSLWTPLVSRLGFCSGTCLPLRDSGRTAVVSPLRFLRVRHSALFQAVGSFLLLPVPVVVHDSVGGFWPNSMLTANTLLQVGFAVGTALGRHYLGWERRWLGSL
jgi:hypothetical protein